LVFTGVEGPAIALSPAVDVAPAEGAGVQPFHCSAAALTGTYRPGNKKPAEAGLLTFD
jgi:hypothetical protein